MNKVVGHGQKASRKREALIAALLMETSVDKAAAKVGISTSTAFNWLNQPDFQEAYDRARQQVVEEALEHLQQATAQAVSTLQDIMQDKNAPASARVTASKVVLDKSLQAREQAEILKRIEEIERQVRRRIG